MDCSCGCSYAHRLYLYCYILQVSDREGVKELLRISVEELEFVLNKVAPLITKQDTNMRLSISAKERLVLTLRFLATGLFATACFVYCV